VCFFFFFRFCEFIRNTRVQERLNSSEHVTHTYRLITPLLREDTKRTIVARGTAEARAGSLGDPARDRAADTILATEGTARNTGRTSGPLSWPRSGPGPLAANELTTSNVDRVTHLLSTGAAAVSDDALARPPELVIGISSGELGPLLGILGLIRRPLRLVGVIVLATITPLLQPFTNLASLAQGPLAGLLREATDLAEETTTTATVAPLT